MTYLEGTAQRVCQIALEEIGYVEEPVNITKYGKHTGADGLPWCGSFVNWCFQKAGVKLPSMVSTSAGAARMKDVGRWTQDPAPGDLAFMDFPHDGIDRISHIGIVVKVGTKNCFIVEGNTSGTGNQRNGGQVMLKKRPTISGPIVGYARPKFVTSLDAFPVVDDVADDVIEEKPKKKKGAKKNGTIKGTTSELG
jgi:hypothetical protein